ncbi:MAG: hypothetical protein U1F54_19515 [Burkholderiales bacterium]
MNDTPLTSVDANARALAALVEEHRATRCEAIAGEARAQAQSLVRTARAHARAMARRAFDEARERRALRIASASAEVATRIRVAEQHRLRALLEHGMRMLPDALEQRWRDPVHRAAWVAHIVDEARAKLPPGAWRVLHPADFTAEERTALSRAAAAPLEFAASGAIRAGLRIEAPPNAIDGTLEGILASRDDVEAQMLVCVTQERRAAGRTEST